MTKLKITKLDCIQAVLDDYCRRHKLSVKRMDKVIDFILKIQTMKSEILISATTND